MELLALHKAMKKPPRSDERDGALFCGTAQSYLFIGGRQGGSTFWTTAIAIDKDGTIRDNIGNGSIPIVSNEIINLSTRVFISDCVLYYWNGSTTPFSAVVHYKAGQSISIPNGNFAYAFISE